MRRTGLHISVLIVILAGAACADREATVTVESVLREDLPDQESWDPALFISEDGMPRIHLRAAYMARYDTPDSTYMVLGGNPDSGRVRVDLFDSEGDTSAVVLADRILYFEREGRFDARGNVQATAEEGRRLSSEHLAWTEENRRISTPGFARIVTPGQTISGTGLTANEDLTDFRLARVSGIIQPDSVDNAN